MNTGLEEAIRICGGSYQLAKRLDAHKPCYIQKVISWTKNGVPAVWVLLIEHVSGVSRHKLRPDIYPEEK